MTSAELMWGVMGLGLIAYAVSGGADLGAGLWSLLAWGERRDEQRHAARHAIAPIWEANHVWLIFVIVLMFSSFPRAFAALSIALHIPIGLALLGIVFRGAAYTFRAYGLLSERTRGWWERTFAIASALTPFCLGLVVGGVSSGAIRVVQGEVVSGFLAGWTSAFAVSVGALSLALFAMLAAVYLAEESTGAVREDFRRRAIAMELVAAIVAAVTFFLARRDAPLLYANLSASGWTWPVQIGTALLAAATLAGLWKGRTALARVTAAAQVATVVLGWGLAMRGHLILPDMSLAHSATHPQVITALLVALAAGMVLLLPALFYLYRVFKASR